MSKVERTTRLFLSVLSVVFAVLSVHLLTDPAAALEPHGVILASQPNSALAEIRAYYCGTMAVMSMIFLRGASWGSPPSHRRDALAVAFSLMFLFATCRVYAYLVDGPPELRYSYVLWAVEWAVAAAALGLLRLETSKKANQKL